jgi:hypothetical protein
MAHVRLLTGRFLKLDGQVVETFEAIATGAVDKIPARIGSNGCSFEIGNFLPRL